MSHSLNKVQILGNAGGDPEVRVLPNGDKVASVQIATSDRWVDKNTGETREKVEWHRIVIYSQGLVKVAEQYLSKGCRVYVEGHLQTRKWNDKDGHEKSVTEIVLQGFNANLILLDHKSEAEPKQQERRPAPSASAQAPAFSIDDDVPFIPEFR